MSVDECKNSWSQFGMFLTQQVEAGRSEADISAECNGTSVTWSGILEEHDIDELSATVYISLPRHTIRFPCGAQATLNGVTVSINEKSIPLWRAIPCGTPIIFSAIIGRSVQVGPKFIASPFLPITLKVFSTGEAIASVSLSEGMPL